MDVKKEIDDVLAKWREVTADGQVTAREVFSLAKEAFDVGNALLSADDSKEARDDLADQLENFILQVAERNLSGWRLMLARSMADNVADTVVHFAADYTGRFEELYREKFVPLLTEAKRALPALRVAPPVGRVKMIS
jgi:hypothetical protein